ncbi:MAG: ATP-binding protein [Pirellulales bacterium]
MDAAAFRIVGGDFGRAGAAASQVKELLKKVGVDPGILRRVMIAAYEAEMNVVVHAREGIMRVALDPGRVEIEVADEGPGIADIEQALREGFSTASPSARELGFGAGMGLPNIKKNSDHFEIQSTVGRGTRVSVAIDLQARTVPRASRHSLLPQLDLCCQCLDCLRTCPTKAIRVRQAGPEILGHLCADCTACLETCRTGALTMAGAAEPLEPAADRSLVVPPELLVQFGSAVAPESVLAALETLGYRDVQVAEGWDAALGEAVLAYARERSPSALVIAPVCPAAVNLIETRFPSLVENLAPFLSPLEAAREALAGRRAAFVALCPAERTALLAGAVGREVAVVAPAALIRAVQPLVRKGAGRLEPAASRPEPECGEASGVLRVTGMRHVVDVLEAMENGQLDDVRVIQPYVCDQGCIGSPLLGEDPFVTARRRVTGTRRAETPPKAVRRRTAFFARPGLRLDPDMAQAIAKLARIDQLAKSLPGRNCGLCGSPSCAALAEDVVLGRVGEAVCLYLQGGKERGQ